MSRPPLSRSRDDRVIAGVCAGLAEHLGLPPGTVRIAMLAAAVLGGAGILLYLWLWATVPRAGETAGVLPLRSALTRPVAAPAAPVGDPVAPGAGPGAPEAAPDGADGAGDTAGEARTTAARSRHAPGDRRVRWPIAELLLGACLLIVGVGLVLVQSGVRVNLELILPALAVLAGVGLAWWQIADRDRPDRNQIPRVLGALALVAVGVLMFFVTSREPSAWTVIAAAFAVLAGVALALAPWVLRLNRELIAERSARAREAERSEIAAHLHDSVLQTLALIQQRSEPGSDVARIARGQERELREWLFRAADGDERPPGAASRAAAETELRAHAAALEVEYPVRFELVSVGDSEGIPETIVAAAREAMLNAARHAGGTVTVYLESAPGRVTVDVTDRGPGTDLDALPEGRMGVRESILGRMERAGGRARIVPGPGGTGTSVRLSLPRDAADAQSAASDPESGASDPPGAASDPQSAASDPETAAEGEIR